MTQDRTARVGSRSRRCLAWALALALAGVFAAPAQAMPVKWRSANFKYVVDGKPVRDVLRDFGASQGMVVAVAGDVEGSVVGKFDLTPRQFIDLMALSYGFVYYYNGAVLHISASQGMRSTLVRLSDARIGQLRETLERMNVAEARFPIVYDEVANTALVAGPQEYVDVIREVAIQLEKRTRTGGRSVTRRFPLRFAWAGDRRIGADDVMPGMASLLQALYPAAGEHHPGGYVSLLRSERSMSTEKIAPPLGASAQAEKTMDAGMPALRSAFSLGPKILGGSGSMSGGKANGSTSFVPTTLPAAGGPGTGPADDDSHDDENLPVIVAEVADNALLVRDLPERMPAYEALIASMDVQPRMVEIAVQILDVSDNALSEFGIDWTLRARHLDGRSGNGERTALDFVASGAPATPTGGLLTAVLGNSGQALLARIALLEKTGQARISSRPKVATLNNVAAVMSSEKTFYVKVPGYQTASLYDISAGLDLRVTPMATLGPEGYRIRLDVQVRDGQISRTETVGELPTVTRSQLGTQAFVKQDESLLLAGYAVERDEDTAAGIPGLSDLPVLGTLFRQKTRDRSRTERFFLVTPRVLD